MHTYCFPIVHRLDSTRTHFFLVEEDIKRLQPPPTVSKDRIVQSWYRFLHLLGNPVDLCHPKVPPNFVSGSGSGSGPGTSGELEQLAAAASMAVSVVGAGPGPGLTGTPHESLVRTLYMHHAGIYHRAMTAVAIIVDLFLGRYRVPVIAPKKSVSFDTSAIPVRLHYTTFIVMRCLYIAMHYLRIVFSDSFHMIQIIVLLCRLCARLNAVHTYFHYTRTTYSQYSTVHLLYGYNTVL